MGNGSDYGVRFYYAAQPQPNGLAEAFVIGKEFIAGDNVCLVLGDNIFYGQGFTGMLQDAVNRATNDHISTIFGYRVPNPERFGVAEVDEMGNVIGIEEKPQNPKSNFAVTGLYFYTNEVVELATRITPSPRGELEITDLNNEFLLRGKLHMQQLGRGFAWLDTGTHESLFDAARFVEVVQSRQDVQIACLEEIAWRKGWITNERLRELAEPMKSSAYGQYMLKLANQ